MVSFEVSINSTFIRQKVFVNGERSCHGPESDEFRQHVVVILARNLVGRLSLDGIGSVIPLEKLVSALESAVRRLVLEREVRAVGKIGGGVLLVRVPTDGERVGIAGLTCTEMPKKRSKRVKGEILLDLLQKIMLVASRPLDSFRFAHSPTALS